MDSRQVLTVATDIGYLILKYGGEIYRVEQSARYICDAYNIEQADVFAIPTSIVVTITMGDDFKTKTRRVLGIGVDLDKVDKLNDLSRYICKEKPDYEEIKARIKVIEESKKYSLPMQMLAYGLVAFGFSFVFRANIVEASISFFIGAFVRVLQFLLDKYNANTFLKNAFCSFSISALSYVSFMIVSSIDPSHIMTGALMTLVPGIAITNCMRDFMANDYMAGVTKFAEAIMTALAIALGVAVVLLGFYNYF